MQSFPPAPQKKVFSRRMALLGIGSFAAFTAIGGRLYHLSVNNHEKYSTLSEENRIKLRLIVPNRGLIKDRDGNNIAENTKSFQVNIVPENTPSAKDTLNKLKNIHPISKSSYAKILKRIKKSPKFKPILVFDNITGKPYNRIIAHLHKLPGVEIEEIQTRFYPKKDAFSHILGYTGKPHADDFENKSLNPHLLRHDSFRLGRLGIERLFDDKLRGNPGIEQLEVNAFGRPIHSENIQPSIGGKNIHLTINGQLQHFIYELLLPHKAASAVVINCINGDILSMVNMPSFDNNMFIKGFSNAEWNKLLNDDLNPLNNRAVSSVYSPGSTFKPIVALAALRAGISPNFKVFCEGKIEVGTSIFHCWKKHGHSLVNLSSAMQHSCDIWFYRIAEKIGIEKIAALAREFSFETGVDIPLESIAKGLVGTPKWKKKQLGQPWYLGDTIVAGIGQGYVSASPLQLALMMGRLASGNINLQPNLLKSRTPSPASGAPSAPVINYGNLSDLQLIKKSLWQVVNTPDGTAYKSRLRDASFQMAGKTGTSQVRNISLEDRENLLHKNDNVDWQFRDHALFTAFAPYERPRYAVSVIVEHGGGGSTTAAPIANLILSHIHKLNIV